LEKAKISAVALELDDKGINEILKLCRTGETYNGIA
jgi:hypothetical protein